MHPGATPPSDALELGLNTADPTTLVIDLNCAFASIEQQHDPGLRGRPLAIAAYATDAATIVSSSREARDLGIKTGMRVFEAKAIFPRIAILEPNPPRYREVSDKLMEILERHSPDVLRMSIDEASLNLAGTPDLARLGPEGVGRAVKQAVREEVGDCVTCSIGVSTSIWMAKQASNLNKRDGLERIDHTNLVSVFGRLQLTDLPGSRRPARGACSAGAFARRSTSCVRRPSGCGWRACTPRSPSSGCSGCAASRSAPSRAPPARATATRTCWPGPPARRTSSRSC